MIATCGTIFNGIVCIPHRINVIIKRKLYTMFYAIYIFYVVLEFTLNSFHTKFRQPNETSDVFINFVETLLFYNIKAKMNNHHFSISNAKVNGNIWNDG